MHPERQQGHIRGAAGAKNRQPAAGRSRSLAVSFWIVGTLVAAAMQLSTAAEAQTVSTLISNVGQDDEGGRYPGRNALAQEFVTGNNTNGYTLSSVGLQASLHNRYTATPALVVTLRAKTSSNLPASTALATFTNPSSISEGLSEFTAPANVTLSANTSYYIHAFQDVSNGGFGWLRVHSDRNDPDSGAAPGWSIPDEYLLVAADGSWSTNAFRSLKIQVKGTIVDASNAAAVGTPTITGTAGVGHELTAVPGTVTDADGGVPASVGDFIYQWQRESAANTWSNIPGASAHTYTPGDDDEGKRVRVVVSFTDANSNYEELTSIPTASVAQRGNFAATGEPLIVGSLVVGQELTAVTDDFMDGNNLGTFSYTWFRADNSSGSGSAQASVSNTGSYSLVGADLGKHMRVAVSFTDGDGFEESLRSDWTPVAVASSSSTLPVVTIVANKARVVASGNSVASFTVTRTGSTSIGLAVSFGYSGNALQGSSVLGEVIIDAGSTMAVITVELNTLEPQDVDHFGTISLQAGNGYVLGNPSSARVTSTAVNVLPVVTVRAKRSPVIGGSEAAEFSLTRSGGRISESLTVHVSVSGEGAASAEVNPRRLVTFMARSTTVEVSIQTNAIEDDGVAPLVTLEFVEFQGYEFAAPGTASVVVIGATSGTAFVSVTAVHEYVHNTNLASFTFTRVGGDMTSSLTVNIDINTPGLLDAAGQTVTSVEIPAASATLQRDFRTVAQVRGLIETLTVSVESGSGYTAGNPSSASVRVRSRDRKTTGNPVISGIAVVGQSLRASAGSVSDRDGLTSPNAIQYTWQRSANIQFSSWSTIQIDGQDAVSPTYELQRADLNRKVRVIVTVTDDIEYTISSSVTGDRLYHSDPYPTTGTVAAASTLELPTIAVAAESETVVGLNSDAVFVVSRTGAASSAVEVEFTMSGSSDAYRNYSSRPSSITIDANQSYARVVVETSAQDNEASLPIVLTIDEPVDRRYMINASGRATVNVVGPGDNTAATGRPSISGRVEIGQTLTAGLGNIADADDQPTEADLQYQWQRQETTGGPPPWTDIADARTSTYILSEADEGKPVRVKVSFDDQVTHVTETVFSEATVPVPAISVDIPNRPATGEPALSSVAPLVGQAVIASTESIADADGLPSESSGYSYQWRRAVNASGANAADIAGANSASYTPNMADVGKHLQVVVSFTDSKKILEKRSSVWTAAVAESASQAQNTPATGAPTISGTPAENSTLAASTSDILDSDGLIGVVFQFQWQRASAGQTDWGSISGATSMTYVVAAADAGKILRVVVSFRDEAGNLESLASEATQEVPTTPEFSIAAMTGMVEEPAPGDTATTLIFNVTVSRPIDSNLSVTYSFSGAATENIDYIPPSSAPRNTLTFIAGGERTQTLTLSVIGDFISERGGEKVVVTLDGSRGVAIGTESAAEALITERENQVEVSAAIDKEFVYSEADQQTSFRFDILLAAPAASAGDVEWRAVYTNPVASSFANGRSEVPRVTQLRTGIVSFAVNERRKSVSGSFGGELPFGGRVEVQLTPFDSAAVSAVAPSDDLGEEDEETLTVSSQVWVVAGVANVRSSEGARDRAATSVLSAFGRSVATSLVETVWNRAEAHRFGGMESSLTLGNRSIDSSAFRADSSAWQATREVAKLFGIEAVRPPQDFTFESAGDLRTEGSIDDFKSWAGYSDSDGIAGKSSFSLAVGGGARRNSVIFWGEGNISNFESELEDDHFSDLTTDGSASTISVGLDHHRDEALLSGFAVSRSSGSSDYKFANSSDGSGDLSSSLTSITPWIRWRSTAGTEIWGAIGIGWGAADGKHNGEEVEMDLNAQIIAAGVWSRVAAIGGFNVAAKADAFSATVSTEGSGELAEETDAVSRRIRLATEMSSFRPESSERLLAYAFELGARHDSGEAESGVGVDVAAEIDYGRPRSSIKVTGRGGMALYHGQEGFSETGIGVGIAYDRNSDDRGLLLSLQPEWNVPRLSVNDTMWNAASSESLRSASGQGAAIEARLGFGAGTLNDHALATLYGSVRKEENESRLRIGSELKGQGRRIGGLRFDLYVEYGDRDIGPERAVQLEGSLKY